MCCSLDASGCGVRPGPSDRVFGCGPEPARQIHCAVERHQLPLQNAEAAGWNLPGALPEGMRAAAVVEAEVEAEVEPDPKPRLPEPDPDPAPVPEEPGPVAP